MTFKNHILPNLFLFKQSRFGKGLLQSSLLSKGSPFFKRVVSICFSYVSQVCLRWRASVLREDALLFPRCALLGSFAVDG